MALKYTEADFAWYIDNFYDFIVGTCIHCGLRYSHALSDSATAEVPQARRKAILHAPHTDTCALLKAAGEVQP